MLIHVLKGYGVNGKFLLLIIIFVKMSYERGMEYRNIDKITPISDIKFIAYQVNRDMENQHYAV